MDGFDHYAFANITTKWFILGSDTYNTMSAGRNGNCYRVWTAGTNCYIWKVFDDQASWVVGFAFKFSDATSVNTGIFTFRDTTITHLTLQLIPTTFKLSLIHGDGTVLATSTNSLNISTWYYIELKVTIDNAGSYELRVNGSSDGWIPPANGDTRNGGNASANVVRFGHISAGTAISIFLYFDDIYILDGAAGLNDFLGDVKVQTLYPDGNGSHSDFTGNDADKVDNYLQVYETIMDSDTTYNYSSTVGAYDTYAFEDTTAINILGVQTNTTVRKDDSGTRSIKPVCISGVTTEDGTEQFPSADSYIDFMQIYETDPNTADLAWETSDLNAAEFGIKVQT